MPTISLSELVADLYTLGLSSGPAPVLPKGTRPPAEVLDQWARTAALGASHAREATIWAIGEVPRLLC